MNPDFLLITKETEEEFEQIADSLLNSYAIQNHETTFRLTDIEFYWNSPNHFDESTYKRKYVNPKNGDWFFHYSGVDIALRNDSLSGHGGILIRGIIDINSNEKYSGPLICCMKLFSGTNAFSMSIETRVIKYNFDSKKLTKKVRVGLGENAKKSGTESLNYRFII